MTAPARLTGRDGGLHMLPLNEGIFGASRRIEALGLGEWR
jgi:hypothetical protein